MNITVAKHDIQKYILSYLMYHGVVRFRDLQPPKVKTNLFSYHLKLLQKNDLIQWTGDGYTLSTLGLAYVDRLDDDGNFAYQQPKMITMFVVQNSDGGILLQHRMKQPYIDTWTLPNGKLYLDEESLAHAAEREVDHLIGIEHPVIRHVGDCYIRVFDNDAPLTVTFVHIFALQSDTIIPTEDQMWIHPRKLHKVTLAPAVEQIVARTFFRDPFFFEEFMHDVSAERS